MKILAEVNHILSGYDTTNNVVWKFDGKNHHIHYGQQKTSYACDVAACREFGECVRHAMECAGWLDKGD